MKYCTDPSQKEGTAYYELYKGKWDKETFWSDDSLLISDRIYCQYPAFFRLLHKIIPSFDPYGITEVSEDQWKQIAQELSGKSPDAQEIFDEIDTWAADVFKKYGCFTILGL